MAPRQVRDVHSAVRAGEALICGADLARVVLGVRTGLARTASRVGGRTSLSSTILELRHLRAALDLYCLAPFSNEGKLLIPRSAADGKCLSMNGLVRKQERRPTVHRYPPRVEHCLHVDLISSPAQVQQKGMIG
eukprot:scaffold9507_cov40-Phaeocystis_antarctica.AAC.1